MPYGMTQHNGFGDDKPGRNISQHIVHTSAMNGSEGEETSQVDKKGERENGHAQHPE